MVLKIIRSPLARSSKRGFTAQASFRTQENTSNESEINCTVLPSKLLVSSLDNNGPLSRVTIAFKVGSRNENFNNLGITHVIRSMTGWATQKCSAFALVRNLQQNGIHFTCTGDREITAFNVVTTRNKIDCAMAYLSAAAVSPAFKHWQVLDNLPRLKYDIGCLTPHVILLDDLHKVCFKKGLGNSLFIRKDLIGNHTAEQLRAFYGEFFSSNRTVVAGYNIDHKSLIELSKTLDLVTCDIPTTPSKFSSGEIRRDVNSDFAHVAVATQGVGHKDIKETLIYGILQNTYGSHPRVAWGGSPSSLYKAVYSVAPEAGVSCFNFNYSDIGLFGFVISSFADSTGKALEAAMKVLKSGTVTEADVKRGKANLKAQILSDNENSENIVNNIVLQSLNGGVVVPPSVLVEAIDKVSFSDVSAAANKIAKGKFSLSAYGSLGEVPHLDEIL